VCKRLGRRLCEGDGAPQGLWSHPQWDV